jgi:hypothetical protein
MLSLKLFGQLRDHLRSQAVGALNYEAVGTRQKSAGRESGKCEE